MFIKEHGIRDNPNTVNKNHLKKARQRGPYINHIVYNEVDKKKLLELLKPYGGGCIPRKRSQKSA